jgi:hypothetical protein
MVADEGRAHAVNDVPPRSRSNPVHTTPGSTPPPATPGRQASRSPGWPFPGMSDHGTAYGERASSSWTSGRSTEGSGYDAASMGVPEGYGAAGPPPGNPSGSLLTFGRYSGWTLGEVARVDLEYLEWLERAPIGRTFAGEVDVLLRAHGRRAAKHDPADTRRGLFRRR